MKTRENKNQHSKCKTYKFAKREKVSYVLQLIIVRLFGKYVKKDEKVWIFGSKSGEKFADNSMYFYKYVKNRHEIRAIWLTNNQQVIEEVHQCDGEAYRMMSFKSLRYILKAKVYIYSTDLEGDIRVYDDRKTVFVNLWHGMPIKKIGYDDQTSKTGDSLLFKINKLIRTDILRYKNAIDIGDIICSTSEYTKKIMESAFKSNKVFITGQARGDIIYDSLQSNNVVNSIKTDKKEKLILYMPTHRGWGKKQTKNIFENKEFLKKLINYCRINNCIFAIRYHPNENMSKTVIKNEYVIDISDLIIDVQDLLTEADILVTDYSSCFIDYAFTKRPIIFYAYDLDEYCTKDMGLYINYEKDVPGPIVCDEKELLQQIIQYVSDNSLYLKLYSDQISKYHKYIDNNSCKRIYDKIIEII